MKMLVQRVSASASYAWLLEWGRLVTITGGAQAIIQALGLVSGILVIRLLPTSQYALYTLANAMLGTMSILADGGISAGVMAQGGKVWQDREKLGTVLATGFELRQRFAVGSLLVATPVLLYLLHAHDASWPMAFLIVAALVPAFVTALSGAILEVAPKLAQDIVPLQRNQVGVNIGRLMLLGLVLVPFPLAFMAVLGGGLPQIWANRRLRKISSRYADWHQQPDGAVRQEIMAFVRRILPGSIYYCLSGQLTIWLISVFGTTVAIAQVGALSRLSMMLGLISVVFSTLVLPRFARLPAVRRLLFARYMQVLAGLVVLSGIIIGLVSLFPGEVLWILGNGYSNLRSVVVLSVGSSCLGLIVGVSFSICTSRGWAVHPALSIPITVAAVACGVILFDVGTLRGILLMNIFVSFIELIIYVSYTVLQIMRLNFEAARG